MLCPFCAPDNLRGPIRSNDQAFAFPDSSPVSQGHTLIAPHRHEPDFFALTPAEQQAIWTLTAEVRQSLDAEASPDGYNVGLNFGVAAGQTVSHAHLHLIPRWEGDVPDPRGGIRWVVPEKAAYWMID